MKKFIPIFITVLAFTACGSNKEDNTTTSVNNVTKTETMSASEEDFPDFVNEIYQSYVKNVNQQDTPLDLGELNKEKTTGGSYYYEFYLSGHSYVQISYDSNGEFYSYSLVLSKDDSNDVLKNNITFAIAATEGISFDEAKEPMQKLVNTFDGSNNSTPIKLEKYKYIIITENSSLLNDSLYMTPLDKKINFNKSDYPKVNAEYMQGSMNKGENVSIVGTVISNKNQTSISELEIRNEEGIFKIFYNTANFAGDFEIGNSYVFYGSIAEISGKYQGRLRIDYFEPL